MTSLLHNRNVWLSVVLGLLGATRVWSMAGAGVAELPHIAAALTVLVPAVIFGVLMQRAWPAAVGLVIVVAIELSLS